MTATDSPWPMADAPALIYLGTDSTAYRIDVGAGLAGLPNRERAIATALMSHASNRTQEEA